MIGVGVVAPIDNVAAGDVPPPGAGFVTVMEYVVAVACSATVIANVSVFASTNVDVRALPFTLTTEAGTKGPPETVIVATDVPPGARLAGERLIEPTAGLFTGSITASEVPPPGAAFTAVSESVPATDTSAAVNATFTCVAPTYVVVCALPFTLITVAGTNPVPVSVTTGELAPVSSISGEIDVIAGAGLSTSRFTGVPVPLLTDPFNTATGSFPPLASCAAGMVAVSFTPLTNVVLSLVPLT